MHLHVRYLVGLSSAVTPVYKVVIQLAKKRLDARVITTRSQLMEFVTNTVLLVEQSGEMPVD